MTPAIVVLDACVLFPAPLRSLLMYLAVADLFRARWTNDIHEEWMQNVQEKYPDISRQQTERIRDLMNAHVRDCLVAGYEPLIENITLPDPDDRHVLAAAIHCEASLILTFNLKDFPPATLNPYGISAAHPDEFLSSQLQSAPETFCESVRRQRCSLKNPPKSVEEFLAALNAQRLPQTVAALRTFQDWI